MSMCSNSASSTARSSSGTSRQNSSRSGRPCRHASSKRSHTASTRRLASSGNCSKLVSEGSIMPVPRSGLTGPLPQVAYQCQPAAHGADGAVQLGGDLVVGGSLQLADGDLLQLRIVEPVEQHAEFVGDQGGEGGVGVGADDGLQSGVVEGAGGRVGAFLPRVILALIEGLAGGEHDQHLPKIVPVGQSGKALLGGGPAETMKRRQGDVLLVSGTTDAGTELVSGQLDHA